jgi:hypothetical protein
MSPKFFPICSMCLNLGSAISYAWAGDLRRTIYWLAAFTLTGSITF